MPRNPPVLSPALSVTGLPLRKKALLDVLGILHGEVAADEIAGLIQHHFART
jgi:hypothetical protein